MKSKKQNKTIPSTISTIDEASAWLSSDAAKMKITPSNLIDAACRSQLHLKVAIPPDCLIVPKENGYGIDPWPITGLLDFDAIDCLALQAQGSVQMKSTYVELAPSGTKLIVDFNKFVTVTLGMLRVRFNDLKAYSEMLAKSNLNASVQDHDDPDDPIDELLRMVKIAAAGIGRSIDFHEMPGIRKNLYELAQAIDKEKYRWAEATFYDKLKGKAKFKRGSSSSDFYRKLFPLHFKNAH